RPAVISTFFNDVYFITAFWTVLMHPNFSSFGMLCHSLWIAVSIGVNRFFGIGFVIKRIIIWNTSIIIQSVNFYDITSYILQIYIAFATFANGEIHKTINIKLNPRPEMLSSSGVWSSFVKGF